MLQFSTGLCVCVCYGVCGAWWGTQWLPDAADGGCASSNNTTAPTTIHCQLLCSHGDTHTHTYTLTQ